MRVALVINGVAHAGDVEPRTSLADFIRERGLTGTKVGCEQGVCGACTVQLDGEPVRSCLTLAVQADGTSIRTIEGLADEDLHPLQVAFHDEHALQCGFCTAGILMTLDAFLRDHPDPTEGQTREALAGNLCRCTGYEGMVRAVAKLRPPGVR
jgi:aerobic-type carbon monoxide dehydrogenase small subunit (CoxS/CutS family)